MPAYAPINTGNARHYFTYPGDYGSETALLVFDTYTGRSDRTNALLWPVLNSAFGGPAGTAGGCNTYCGIDNNLANDFAEGLNADLFIALSSNDPGVLTPADPRPSMPTDLYNPSYNQHLMVRSGFTNTDTMMSITYPNTLINHESGTPGRFEIYANNEWITKGRWSGDDYNYQMISATQSNELSVMEGAPIADTSNWAYWMWDVSPAYASNLHAHNSCNPQRNGLCPAYIFCSGVNPEQVTNVTGVFRLRGVLVG